MFRQENEQTSNLPTRILMTPQCWKDPQTYLERPLLFFSPFFFIKRGIICNQYPAASYEMGACSTDVSCLSLLSDSRAPHLHPHLRWHFSASARIKVVYSFAGQYQEHVVAGGGGGGSYIKGAPLCLCPLPPKKTCLFL